MSRPHWLPEVVWMGVEIGRWPVLTFPSADSAARWASLPADGYERRIWSVDVPEDTVAHKATIVPATFRLDQVHP